MHPGTLTRFLKGIGDTEAPSRLRAANDIAGAQSVLDVGCGPGVFIQTLEGRRVRRYFGIDGSAEFVRQAEILAKQTSIPLASVQLHDLDEPLPFTDDEFDAVVVRHVLEHLERPEFALAEAVRVCSETLVVVFSQFPTSGTHSRITDADMKLPRWAHPAHFMESVIGSGGFTLSIQDQYEPPMTAVLSGELGTALSPREAYWVAEANPSVPPLGG